MTIKLRTVLLLGFLFSPVFLSGEQAEKSAESPSNEILQRFDSIPLHFEENLGQFDERVSYTARGLGYQLMLTSEERVMLIYQPESESPSFNRLAPGVPKMPEAPKAYAVRMQFEGSNENVTVESEGELDSKMHYLIGRDRDAWVRDVSTFQKVRYKNIYDGIDVVYYGNQRRVQYDFIVQPGATFETIRMKFDGVRDIHVSGEGDLVLGLPDGDLIQRRPYIYQEVDGSPVQIQGEFHMYDDETVQFMVKDYDEDLPLVIDPVIEYSKLFGGSGSDVAYGIKVDDTGHVYLTGATSSFDFPTTQPTGELTDVNYNGGTSDIFVSKVAPDGQSFIWSTYIGGNGSTNGSGGSGQDIAYDLAIDAAGNSYIAGATASEDFPADGRYYTETIYEENDFNPGLHIGIPIDSYSLKVDEAADLGFGDGSNSEDAIVLKVSDDGSDLVYSIILGSGSPWGIMYDIAYGVDVDSSGKAYVVGATTPVEPPLEETYNRYFPTTETGRRQPLLRGPGTFDGFLTVLEADPIPTSDTDVTGVLYSSYIGGGSDDYLYELAIDDTNLADVSVWITGASNSFDTNFEESSPFPIIAGPILDSKRNVETNEPEVEDRYEGLLTNPFDNSYNGSFDAFILEVRPSLVPDFDSAPVTFMDREFPEFDSDEEDKTTALIQFTADLGAYTASLDAYAAALTGFAGSYGYPQHWEFILYPEDLPFEFDDPMAPTVEETAASAAFDAAVASYEAAWTAHEPVFEDGQMATYLAFSEGSWLGGGPRGEPNGGDNEGHVGDDGLVPNPGGREFDGDDYGYDVAIDSTGNLYVVGTSTSSDFPTSNNAFQTKYGGGFEAWVFKYDPSQAENNDQMLFSTYLAGSADDSAASVTVNADDEAIVTGYSASENFPVSSNAFDISANGGRDIFLTHLSEDGSSLEFSTFLGGFNNDEGNKVAVNNTFNSERVFLTGYTGSTDFFTTVDQSADPADTFYIRGVDTVGNTIDLVPSIEAGFVSQYNLSLPTPVDNDLFENRRFIGGFESLIVGNNEAATLDAGEPDHGGIVGGKSVWFAWTSVAVGDIIMSTEGSDFDTVISVYTGPSFANFQEIASNDDKDGSVNWSEVRFSVAEGEIFAIVIDGKAGASGDYQFNLSFETYNDLFSYTADESEYLTGLEHNEKSSNVTASREGSEPNHGSASVGKSIWWAWKAPTTGFVEITTDAFTVQENEGWTPVIAAYTADSLNTLEPSLVADNVVRVETDPQTGLPVVVYTGGAAVTFTAQRDVVYRIAVDGPVGISPTIGNITLNIKQGYNDLFSDAEDLADSSDDLYTIYAQGDNFNATQEPLEPQHAGNAGGKSVWWKWTAPSDGLVRVSTFWDALGPIADALSSDELGNPIDTLLAVYVGSDITNLQEVSSDDNSGPSGNSWVEFLATSGATYWIAVDGFFDGSTTAEGNINLQLNLFPENNDLENAAVISGTSLSVSGFNLNADEETGEPDHAGNAGGKSVWWRWTAPAEGRVAIDTSGSDFDTILGIYTGDPSDIGSLAEVTSNDNYTSPDFASQVAFDTIIGTEYFIAVDGKEDSGDVEEGQITLSLSVKTNNNDFLQAFVLTGFFDEDQENNADADSQFGEENHAGEVGGKSLWWTWVAPSTGPVEFNTVGSTVDTLLAVYSGDVLGQLATIASNDDDGGVTSRLTFVANAGERYYIAVDGKAGATGLLNIQLLMPANDDFVNAQVIEGNVVSFNGTTFNADMESGEPTHSTGDSALSGGSVWYKWTAAFDGLARVEASADEVDIGIAAYVGDDFDDFETGQLAVGVNREISFPVGAGQDYYIAVRGNPTDFTFNLQLIEEAIVGTFDGAIGLNGFSDNAIQSNSTAFKEAGEPLHAGNAGGRSVWFEWAAPKTGNLTVSTLGSGFDTLLAVYIGSGLGDLLSLASNDDFAPGTTSQVTVPVIAGQVYHIAVDGKYDLGSNTISTGSIQLSLTLVPSNDEFASATPIGGGAVLVEGYNTNATKEGGEGDHGGNAGGGSVWFEYMAPADGMVVIDTAGSEFDTLLAVYSGDTLGGLSAIAQNDDLGGVITSSRAVVVAAAGDSFKIAVDGKDGEAGNYTLSLFMISENDNFADRIELSGTSVVTSGVTDLATHEFGEPIHAGNIGGRSIWWEWTAPSDGRVDLDADGSDFDTLVAVYTGDTLGELVEVASNDDAAGGGVSSFISTPVTGGTTYKIAVDGKNLGGVLSQGTVAVSLEFSPAPANDNFADAIDLVGTDASDTANNNAASVETGEAFVEFGTIGRSVWWRWTSPAQGQLEIDTLGSDFDTVLALAVGPSVDDLTIVGFNDDEGVTDQSELSVLVGGGTTYYILVDGAAGDDLLASTGDIELNLSFTNATTGGGEFEPADDFEDIVPIVGYGFNISTTNATATQQPFEPLHARNPGGKSIWFEWLAPASGVAQIDTAGSNFDSLLAVYSGDTLDGLVEIVSNDNVSDGDPSSAVQFFATEGTNYLIAIDGHFDSGSGLTDAGEVVLNLSLLPGNDDFDRAIPVGSGSATFTAFNFNGTKEPVEPSHAGDIGGSSIWWQWEPQSDVLVSVDTSGSQDAAGDPLDTLLAIYTGESVGSLTLVGENDNYSSPDGASQISFMASAGEVYYFAVDGKNNGTEASEGVIYFNFVLIKTNNAFSSAASIVGYDPGVIFGSNEGADKETGEPDHAGEAGGASVWWTWVAPQTGPVTIGTEGSVIDTVLSVYTGQTLVGLNLIAENDNSAPGFASSEVTFNAVQGTEYAIAVDGKNGATGGIQLHLKSPSNDDFENAILLSGPEVEILSHNFESSVEVGEPNHIDESARRSVWWKWEAPKDGRVTASTQGSNFDTILAIYAGTELTNLALIVGTDDTEGIGEASVVSFNAASGAEYYILVDGSDDNFAGEETDYVGEIKLTLNLEREQVVGSFSGGDILVGKSVTVTGNNSDAFQEPGEPQHAGNAGGKSLWYTWTAPEDGTLFLDTFGSGIDTLLGIYEGASVSSLAEVASNDDAFPGSGDSSLAVGVLAGTTYHIAVDGSFDDVTGITEAGSIIMNLTLGPTNNDFDNAVPLTGSKGTFTSFVNNADAELTEPFHAGIAPNHSVWWRLSPDINGVVILDTAGSDFDTVLAVYEGTSMTSMVPVANGSNNNHTSPDLTSQVVFQVQAGNIYYIAVDAVSVEEDQGKVYLSYSAVGSSGGDAFADCGTLNGYSDSSSASNAFATRESGEPMHANEPGGKSVWWCWTAPGSGLVSITTEESTISTLVGVYIGPEVTSLLEVVSFDDPLRENKSAITFEAVEGTTYRIAVDGAVQDGEVASGIIFIQLGLGPENDRFLDAFDLGTGPTASTTGVSFNGTLEDGEPVHGGVIGGKSVWWKWTPSIKGRVTIDTQGSSFDTTLGVYRGAALQVLTEIGGNDDAFDNVSYSRLEFLALAGRTYYIAVDGAEGDEGDLVLNINQAPIDDVQLVNVSTRGFVGVDQETMIAGFVVTGNPGESSRVVIRALGNSLVQAGLDPFAVVPDPDAFLVNSDGIIIDSNEQWVNGPAPTLIAEFGLAPIDPNEAVIVTDLVPGSYTVHVRDALGRSGVGLVEVFYVEDENSGGVSSRLINISTRSKTGSGDERVIGGFVVSGSKPKQVLIRGIGESLGNAGVANALSDTMLELFAGGNKIAENDDWQSAANSDAVSALLAPGAASESAILVTLEPGAYTAILSGVGDLTGIALIEIYEVSQ